VQQLSGAAPDVQAASVGGGRTVNVKSVLQKSGLFAGMIIVGVGGLTEERGALNNLSRGGGVPGTVVTNQSTRPGGGPGGVLGQVVVKGSGDATDTLAGSPTARGAHVGSTLGRGRNLLQSSPVKKLKT
jgi:hypothetical protein